MAGLDYWQRLEELQLYSLERRRERYVIIYIFKIITKNVPNFSDPNNQITTNHSLRRGLLCNIPPINRLSMGKYKSLKDESLAVLGPKLFNSIPSELRNESLSLNSFKYKLDKFLSKIWDKPALPNYHQPGRSNSILSQLAVMKRNRIPI